MNCCFTGHRDMPSGERRDKLTRELDDAIRKAYELGFRGFLAGGAMGFDTLAAERVILFRKEHPDVRLTILVPFRDQDGRFPRVDKLRYHEAVTHADAVEVLSEYYHTSCFQVRNAALIDRSDMCVAYLQHMASGTGDTVRRAKRKGIPVVYLDS
ncbi:MAG TPA: SLOG family protein [Eubacteriales bacterium]|nr:SLOG family protein [Clostridia bacterium]HRV73878.1 SLOG family protein [Eubacteriales bacterium]